MITTQLSAFETSKVEIRPIEFRDEAYVTVNEHYYALQPAVTSNISSGLREGSNVLQFVVTTCGLLERVRRGLADKDWCGRFELLIDGKRYGSYAGSGIGLLGGNKYIVATIELNIIQDPSILCLRRILNKLQAVPGMTNADRGDCGKSTLYLLLKNGVEIRTWKNLVGFDHVFVTNSAGVCLFGGYVGWIHSQGLHQTLQEIRQEFSDRVWA